MNRDVLRPVAYAVARWLSFQDLCRRSDLFSEAYLSQPIGEYLMSNYKGRLQPESDHPNLQPNSMGRPKQLDYTCWSPESKVMVMAMECKWIGPSAYSKQALFDDILRLEVLRTGKGHVGRYFLVAGTIENFRKNFEQLNFQEDGKRQSFSEHFLSFSKSSRDRSVSWTKGKQFRRYYRQFEKSYAVELPKTFKTRLVAMTFSGSIKVALWEVSSVKNRSTFSALDTWT